MVPGKLKDPNLRWWLTVGAALALAIVVVVGGWRAYSRWNVNHLVGIGRNLLASGDQRGAAIALQRALQIDPAHVGANRGMAELTEKLGLATSLDWRRAVVELGPAATPDALALAKTALTQRQTGLAQQALAQVGTEAQAGAEFYTLSGVTAISAGNFKEAEKNFELAARADPQNPAVKYNLAAAQVQSPDAAKRQAGAATLAELAGSGQLEVVSRRSLITRLLREKKMDEALRWSTELQNAPGVEFRDRLMHLSLLRALNKPEITEAITVAETAARTAGPDDVAALINWRRSIGEPKEALRWVESLDAKLVADPQVSAARAECLAAMQDWAALQVASENGTWGEHEYRRLGFLALASREQGDVPSSRAHWNAALNEAGKSRTTLSQLAWMASQWGWTDELKALLWVAADQPNPSWALQMLHRLYLAERDTASMLRTAEKALQIDPKSANARNNVALLSLLLGRNPEESARVARELHESAPENASFASTHALALHLSGRTAEGRAVIEKLKPEQLQEPSVAAYYAILLAASGSDVQPYLKLAQAAPLLPEERALLESRAAR